MFSNATKVWFFLLGICLAFLVLGEQLAGRTGLLVGFLLAVALNLLVFLWGESRLLSAVRARPVRGRDPWGLSRKVTALSEALGIPTPALHIVDSPSATAFSVGFSARRPSVCVTTGLLERLDDDEVDVVLAHQLCHVARTDSFGFGVTSVLANMLLGLAQALDAIWPPNFFFDRKRRPFLVMLSPLSWLMIRTVARRSTFLENDLAAADLLQSRQRLGEVLWKLDGLAQTRPLSVPPGAAHLFIVDPEGVRRRNYFLRLHPPLAERLRELTGTPTV